MVSAWLSPVGLSKVLDAEGVQSDGEVRLASVLCTLPACARQTNCDPVAVDNRGRGKSHFRAGQHADGVYEFFHLYRYLRLKVKRI